MSENEENENNENNENNEFEIEKKENEINDNEISEETKQKIKEFKEREVEYLSKISDLKIKLKTEKQKNQFLQNPEEEMAQINYDKKKLEEQIKTLLSANSIQREKLEEISKKVDDRIYKLSFKKLSNKVKIDREYNSKNKKKFDGLSIKKIQANNINNLIEIYRNDNNQLKRKCESIGNLKDRFKLMDENKKYKNQIDLLNKEIIQKKKLLKEHLTKCIKNKEIYFQNLMSFKEELNQLKIKKDNLDIKLKQVDHRLEKVEEYNEKMKENENNKLKILTPRNKQSEKKNEEEKKNFEIPENIYEIFQEDELNYILQAMKNDDKKFQDFIKKIIAEDKNIESLGKRHEKEIKMNNNKIDDLKMQINFVSEKTQNEAIQKKLYISQSKEYENNEKAYNQKYYDLENERKLLSKNIINQEKNIKQLTTELEKLRKLVDNSDKDALIDYINETKFNAENAEKNPNISEKSLNRNNLNVHKENQNNSQILPNISRNNNIINNNDYINGGNTENVSLQNNNNFLEDDDNDNNDDNNNEKLSRDNQNVIEYK